jgi:tetratricopeptide (TPR) repeat protein
MFEAALNCLSRASSNQPSAETFTALGVTQFALEMTDEARESFRKAISLDATHAEAYYNLATTLRNCNNEEAISLLKKAIEIDPNYAIAHRELGLMFRLTGQSLDAQYHLQRAIELEPTDGWAHVYLGNLLWMSKELTSANRIQKGHRRVA